MKFNQGIPQNTIEIKEAIQETIVEETFVNNNTPPSTEKNGQEVQKDNLFIFEPLHTIDYFASQGIKLQQEQLGNDNFSQQVKTFTQWLKSMKKIYQDAPSLIPQKDEGGVVLMADASNKNEEIYTETMAEVLINQGKKTQAIAIYEKLSLLYPEKSSYFTARISELNK
jgi:hypothetical protein